MIRVSQLKLPLSHTKEELFEKLRKKLRVEKEEIHYTYAIDVILRGEKAYLKRNHDKDIIYSTTVEYIPPKPANIRSSLRPVVCGSGPAGMFCAYFLSFAGYRPIIIERGEAVEKRAETVECFFAGKELNPESNVQFGEGGAGTFSDGKLNTMVKDTYGRIHKVLELFVRAGAPEEILYQNKPHIGTDRLRVVVANLREQIKEWGGEFHFNTKLNKIHVREGKLTGISCISTKKEKNNTKSDEPPKEWEISTDCLILAIGHSARDTLEMLRKAGLLMEAKSFAVGVRVEHEQEFINRAQYKAAAGILPAADYKLTYTAKTGRGIYSFCMCPGGYVVNASSEEGHLVVNGMSNYDRAGRNANSALVVTVNPADFADKDPLAGMYFQRHFERLAYRIARGKIPYQLYGDLLCGRESGGYGRIIPCHMGGAAGADLRECLPDFVTDTLLEGIQAFDRMLPGFADEEAVFSGVEMRTSSPVRILRNEHFQSSISGIYPCGEGAGYAGGIMSAAVDGIKVFEAIAAL